jgi:hypothetical protein
MRPDWRWLAKKYRGKAEEASRCYEIAVSRFAAQVRATKRVEADRDEWKRKYTDLRVQYIVLQDMLLRKAEDNR